MVDPPQSAPVGERITFSGFESKPDEVLNPKKKVWETIQPDLHTDNKLVACYKDLPFTTSVGICKVSSISDGSIRWIGLPELLHGTDDRKLLMIVFLYPLPFFTLLTVYAILIHLSGVSSVKCYYYI